MDSINNHEVTTILETFYICKNYKEMTAILEFSLYKINDKLDCISEIIYINLYSSKFITI